MTNQRNPLGTILFPLLLAFAALNAPLAWGAAPAEPRMLFTVKDPQHRLVLADEKGVEIKTIRGFSMHQQWSPDGSRILLEVKGKDYSEDVLAVMDLDLKLRRVRGQPHPDSYVTLTSPTWSSDGRSIMVVGSDEGIVALGVDDDTSDVAICPQRKDVHVSKAYPSPDGKKFAFTGYLLPQVPKNRKDDDVFVMEADCSAPVRLTTDEPRPFELRWSRDGRKLAFIDSPAKPTDNKIIVMDITGANRKEFKEGYHHSVSWGDDGRLLATWSDRSNPKAKYPISGSSILRPAWPPSCARALASFSAAPSGAPA